MKTCTTCGARYRGEIRRCPFDGGVLEVRASELEGATLAERFKLGQAIGRGAIGEVFRAVDLRSEQAVAIKMLHADLALERLHQDRFMRETQAMMRLSHKSLVDVLATSDAAEPRPWFAMALYRGQTLAQHLAAAGRFQPASALAIVLAVARALAVVHRDLKPANIMLEGTPPELVPIVLDFGLASVQGEPGLTETGDLLGTPQYMSPEQIQGHAPCAAMDHYALGCAWFELLTGRPPFVGKASAVLDAHLSEPAPSVSDFGVCVSPTADRALCGLLAKSADERTLAFASLVAGAVV
jgi:eukaryotic-like serine/threonine-protein kinase